MTHYRCTLANHSRCGVRHRSEDAAARHAALLGAGWTVTPLGDGPAPAPGARTGRPRVLVTPEQLEAALRAADGVITRAAVALGIGWRTADRLTGEWRLREFARWLRTASATSARTAQRRRARKRHTADG